MPKYKKIPFNETAIEIDGRVVLSFDPRYKEYLKWREENPDWDKDWSKGCAGVGEVGEWQEKLVKKNPGWNDVLRKASKMPGATVKPFSV